MNNMFAMVLFLIVITSTSSALCANSNNDGDIFMVVDAQTTMNDAGMGMTKANPVQIGKFLLEDRNVLTLSRKSSPSRNCVNYPGAPCGLADWCCEGLSCDGAFEGKCNLDPYCVPKGGPCALISNPCCFPSKCSGVSRGSTCL